MVTVEDLYKHFGVLADAKDDIVSHEAEYKAILEGVKAGKSEKRLSSQFIIRFFKDFPSLIVDSINAMFDLCEDPDIMIRKQAIKDLPQICKVQPEQVSKITEALTTLLICDDSSELTLIHSSLISLFKINPKEALSGLLSPLSSEDSDATITEHALKFLNAKLKLFNDDWLNGTIEEFIVQEFKRLLADASKDEFLLMMDILKQLTIMSTVTGRQQLVDLIVTQAELNQPFNVKEVDNLERLIQCGQQAAPLFSKNVHSRPFVEVICTNILPVLTDLPTEFSDVELELYKLLADIVEQCGDLDTSDPHLQAVYDKLLTYMPEPVESPTDTDIASTEPALQFSHVECLLIAFHHLAKKYPQFLASDENADRLKIFKSRLQYFTRGVQTYIRQLRAALHDKSITDLNAQENKMKVVALKTTTNINQLAKDLLHTPPSYKSVVTPSWAPTTKASDAKSPGEKRTSSSSDTTAPTSKQPRAAQSFYSPPKDKYSANYNKGSRGGGGRGWRGRGYRY